MFCCSVGHATWCSLQRWGSLDVQHQPPKGKNETSRIAPHKANQNATGSNEKESLGLGLIVSRVDTTESWLNSQAQLQGCSLMVEYGGVAILSPQCQTLHSASPSHPTLHLKLLNKMWRLSAAIRHSTYGIAHKSPQQQFEGNRRMSAAITFWASLTKCQTITMSWQDYPLTSSAPNGVSYPHY